MKKHVPAIAAAALAGVLAGAGLAATPVSASTVTNNPWEHNMTNTNADGLVVTGSTGPNNNALLVKDNLGQPIFSVLEAGGAAILGDNFRVLAGNDVFNAVVTVSPDAPSGSCPKPNALWVGPGNVWKCVNGNWRAPRDSLW